MKDSNNFFVSNRSKRGIFIFLILALIIVLIPRILFLLQPEEHYSISKSDITELKEIKKYKSIYKHSSFTHKRTSKFHKPAQKFDPNQYSEKDWLALGLSKKQTSVVLKFTSRGIYSNDQLEKIFVIPTELYVLIKDSTYYPLPKEYKESYKKEKSTFQVIEINSSEQENLETIPGIGAFYAKNIIKYRERIGGFYYKEQVMEVWKMDIEKYNSIEKYIQVDPTKITPIALNSVTVEKLKDHPYLNWNIANSIIKMRNQKGSFKSINDIKESILIDEELFNKIKPYLSL